MGIRVLCPVASGFPSEVPLPPGAAYLASLRSRYGAGSSFAPHESDLADRIAKRLSSCYTELRREVSRSSEGRLMSLYFLTPRDYVERFRNRARQLFLDAGARALLTGPWPPYSFACDEGVISGAESME